MDAENPCTMSMRAQNRIWLMRLAAMVLRWMLTLYHPTLMYSWYILCQVVIFMKCHSFFRNDIHYIRLHHAVGDQQWLLIYNLRYDWVLYYSCVFVCLSCSGDIIHWIWWHIWWPTPLYKCTWTMMTLWSSIIHVLCTVFTCLGDSIYWIQLTTTVASNDSLSGLLLVVLLI